MSGFGTMPARGDFSALLPGFWGVRLVKRARDFLRVEKGMQM
jgi:hypothetical protein